MQLIFIVGGFRIIVLELNVDYGNPAIKTNRIGQGCAQRSGFSVRFVLVFISAWNEFSIIIFVHYLMQNKTFNFD